MSERLDRALNISFEHYPQFLPHPEISGYEDSSVTLTDTIRGFLVSFVSALMGLSFLLVLDHKNSFLGTP